VIPRNEGTKAIGEGPEPPQSHTFVPVRSPQEKIIFLLVSQPQPNEWPGQLTDQEVEGERDTGTVCESRFAHLLEYEVQVAWGCLIGMVMIPISVHHFKS